MKHIKYLAVIIMMNFILVGYTKPSVFLCVNNNSMHETYTVVQKKLQQGKFKEAIKILENLYYNYPSSPYSEQIQLDLIYAYYKSSTPKHTQEFIAQVIQINPAHPNMDYILYIRALTDLKMGYSKYYSKYLLGADPFRQNNIYIKRAYYNFIRLLRSYPESQYAIDARRRLIFLKQRLAQFELEIVKFYVKRGAYIIVINRVEDMIKNYPDTQATYDALPLIEQAYLKLQLIAEANTVAKIIANNKHI